MPEGSEPITAANLERLERAGVWNMGDTLAFAYSPDSSLLAVGKRGGILLVDPLSLFERGFLPTHLMDIFQLNFSQDGSLLTAVEGLERGQIQIEVFDVSGRRLLKSYPPGFTTFAPGDPASFAAFRQQPHRHETWDEQGLSASIQPNAIILADASGEASLPAYGCTTLSLSSDSARLAAACSDGIRAWDTASKKLLTLVPGKDFMLSPDGQALVIFQPASRQNDYLRAELWRLKADGKTYERQGALEGLFLEDNWYTAAGGFAPDGRFLHLFQVIEGDQQVKGRVDWLILSPLDGSIIQRQTIYTSPGWSVDIALYNLLCAPDGTSAVALFSTRRGSYYQNTLTVARLNGSVSFISRTNSANQIGVIEYTPDGRLAVYDGALQLMNGLTGVYLGVRNTPPFLRDIKFSPISQAVSFAANPSHQSNDWQGNFLPFQNSLAAFSPDGKWVAWGEMPLVYLAPNQAPFFPVFTLKSLGHSLSDIDFSPDSSLLILANTNSDSDSTSTLHIYDTSSGAELLHFDAQGYAEKFRFTPDNQYLVGMDSDCTHGAEAGGMCIPILKVWQVSDGKEVAVLPANFPLWYDLSPDGQLVAAIARDGHMLFYSIPDGTVLEDYSLGLSGNGALAFSSDGKRLAVGLADGSIHIFAIPPAP